MSKELEKMIEDDSSNVRGTLEKGMENRDHRATEVLSSIFTPEFAAELDATTAGIESMLEQLRGDVLKCLTSETPVKLASEWFERRGGDELKEKALYSWKAPGYIVMECVLVARSLTLYLRALSRIEAMMQERGHSASEDEQVILDALHGFAAAVIMNEPITVAHVVDISSKIMAAQIQEALFAAAAQSQPEN